MPRFKVFGTVTAGKYPGEFTAEDEEDAVEQALNSDASSVCLCHQCADECENAEIESADAVIIQESNDAR